MREKEHMKDAKQLEGVSFTRAKIRESQTEYHQSALTDHVAVCNHTIDWEGVKLPAKDKKRYLRGHLYQKAGPHATNSDKACHHLPDVYSKLLLPATTPPGDGDQKH